MGDQQRAYDDAEHVLKELDLANPKALFRRAMANKHFTKFEEAVRDLQTLHKQDPSKQDIKKELDESLKKLVENQKKKKEAEEQKKNQPKIQEISQPVATSTKD